MRNHLVKDFPAIRAVSSVIVLLLDAVPVSVSHPSALLSQFNFAPSVSSQSCTSIDCHSTSLKYLPSVSDVSVSQANVVTFCSVSSSVAVTVGLLGSLISNDLLDQSERVGFTAFLPDLYLFRC